MFEDTHVPTFEVTVNIRDKSLPWRLIVSFWSRPVINVSILGLK